jgi:hypothetical protein
MSWSVPRAIAVGALAVGVLDGLDAIVFFGLRSGTSPVRIGQAIASGLLGRAAFDGGVSTALLGLALHFFIATCIVATYVGASRLLPTLALRPLLWGPLYGVAAWATMQWIVLPLAGLGGGAGKPPVMLNGILIHIFGVGLPSALAARMAWRATPAATAVPSTA